MEEQTCAGCRFYRSFPEYPGSSTGYDGVCRRYPPAIIDFGGPGPSQPAFPPVGIADWCGEFKSNVDGLGKRFGT